MKEKGFTLIELLVVLVIIAILTTAALPIYTTYQKTTWRKLTQAELLQIASELEASYSHTGYKSVLYQDFPKDNPKYRLRLEKQSNNHAFILIAQPLGSQKSDGALSIDSQGQKRHYTHDDTQGTFTHW